MDSRTVKYLESLGYSDSDIEITAICLDIGMDLPSEVVKDLHECWYGKKE